MWRENVFHSIDTFREVSSLEIEQDENRCLISPISCCSSSGQLAIVHGTSLIILSPGGDAELEVQAELEFERPLEAVCWAPGQPLVIAGDDSGMLHFITASGMLVFSKRLAQGIFEPCTLLFLLIRYVQVTKEAPYSEVSSSTATHAARFCLLYCAAAAYSA